MILEGATNLRILQYSNPQVSNAQLLQQPLPFRHRLHRPDLHSQLPPRCAAFIRHPGYFLGEFHQIEVALPVIAQVLLSPQIKP